MWQFIPFIVTPLLFHSRLNVSFPLIFPATDCSHRIDQTDFTHSMTVSAFYAQRFLHVSYFSFVRCRGYLARDAFIRMNRRDIAMIFVCLSVCLSVWDGRALWSYGHFSAYLSLWFDSPMFWAPWYLSRLFQLHLEERWGMGVQTKRRIKRYTNDKQVT